MLQNHFPIYALPTRLKELGFVPYSPVEEKYQVFEYGVPLERELLFTHPDLPYHLGISCNFRTLLFGSIDILISQGLDILYSIFEAKEIPEEWTDLSLVADSVITYESTPLASPNPLWQESMVSQREILRSIGFPQEYLEPSLTTTYSSVSSSLQSALESPFRSHTNHENTPTERRLFGALQLQGDDVVNYLEQLNAEVHAVELANDINALESLSTWTRETIRNAMQAAIRESERAALVAERDAEVDAFLAMMREDSDDNSI